MPDREKVIEELENLRDICNAKSNMAVGNGKIAWAGYANTADDAIGLLKEQKPKTGKWILADDDANAWECSECGALQQIIDGNPSENNWYFCPHCGAKLKEQAVK